MSQKVNKIQLWLLLILTLQCKSLEPFSKFNNFNHDEETESYMLGYI